MVHDHHGKDPDPPGSAQVSQKTIHASSTYNIKPAFSYYGSLVMGYSRHQIVAPPIAELSLCFGGSTGGPPGSVDRIGIHVALPRKCPSFGLFVHSPAPPPSSLPFRSYLGVAFMAGVQS